MISTELLFVKPPFSGGGLSLPLRRWESGSLHQKGKRERAALPFPLL